jgi:hypothetical protein
MTRAILAQPIARINGAGELVVVHFGKISPGVYPEYAERVRDENRYFACHFERMREIFPL